MYRKILNVSQVNIYIKQLFDHDYILQNISVQGEISNYKLHSSGHAYFTLKDADAAISCVFFKGYRLNSSIDLNNGLKVIIKGNVSVYERDGKYQIYVKEVSNDGLGFLYQKFELLKKECEAKGYFDQSVKKVIPEYARSVGIVTSQTGAAVQDMINVSKRRNPYIELILYPAMVQGENAYKTVVEGINYFNDMNQVDVIIIGRGGGSIEDLWAFNEKAVVEAIYKSHIPVISAVGHETDFTLSDFAADLRAPTPSAGAELAVFDYGNLLLRLDGYELNLNNTMARMLETLKQKLINLDLRLQPSHILHLLELKKNYMYELGRDIDQCMAERLQSIKQTLALIDAKLEGLSPMNKLKSGYAYITKDDKSPVTSIKEVVEGEKFVVTIHDGIIDTVVTKTIPNS